MPLYRDFSDDNATILVWKYDETEELDIDKLLEPENAEKVKDYHPKKLLEVLMVRKLLKGLKPHSKILYKEREPFLSPKDAEISITHSFPFAAIAISKNKIGIDIEKFNPKILRVIDKFTYENERGFIPFDNEVTFYTIIWSVKESMYKIHHSKHWSLKKHYEVRPFELKYLHNIKCRVHDETMSDEFKARVEFFDEYCFTIVEE
ncbi:4'-phosphopantetheinyl transferase [Chryseobacterium sp. SLBN-27]|jgi:4'-phosphopantetheinyl transferase EntD|uniref:4'-phosphopantetheinyl transferase family protein n=1 Tax=Chryseobacterium TaxID=59732 RepID=UPI00285FD442|nr:4'-phosphopantetheinyl transferase superfamily protein [Chryseobacterium sp. SLBN-27]MDR6156755.1 4'-phosphopantetheinyl transferase [Chryseobacterium sp. SLBN-27]